MHLTQSFRFRGYWHCLLSWLVLTFASPFSAALAQTDDGWMRLCSTYGVHWVKGVAVDDTTPSAQCHCLGYALVPHLFYETAAVPTAAVTPGAEYLAPLVLAHYFKPPSRAPPVLIGEQLASRCPDVANHNWGIAG